MKVLADDLFGTPLDQAEIDFKNEGGETYICGNPPYLGSVYQTDEQKADLKAVFDRYTSDWKSLDYVAGWFQKAAQYGIQTKAVSAFVSTNSICQGEQVPILWPLVFKTGHQISFAYRSFKWSNLASNKAGVTVVIVGISAVPPAKRKLFDTDDAGIEFVRLTDNIGPYLVPGPNITVSATSGVSDERGKMIRGNMPNDGGHLVLAVHEADELSPVVLVPPSSSGHLLVRRSSSIRYQNTAFGLRMMSLQKQASSHQFQNASKELERQDYRAESKLGTMRTSRTDSCLRRIETGLRLLFPESRLKIENFFQWVSLMATSS